MKTRSAAIFLVLTALLALAAGLNADTVQLMNGDTVSGKVLSLDAKQLKLQSDALGTVTIDRAKVATIHLGDAVVPKVAAVPAPVPGPKPAKQPLDVIEQLKLGVDQGTLNDIKKAFPLLATPEANKYFEGALGGLMSGSLNIGDVRKDALKAVGELKKLEKELGPQGAQALQGYMGILEHFLKETEPKKAEVKSAPPQKK